MGDSLNDHFEIVETRDGSRTLRHPTGVTYHSVAGAAGESRHVFIKAGQVAERLRALQFGQPLHVLEVGYGTGLNALLTLQLAEDLGCAVDYVAYEPSAPPRELRAAVLNSIAGKSNLAETVLAAAEATILAAVGASRLAVVPKPWPQPILKAVDVVFYDAFAPSAAPELWTEAAIAPALAALAPGGCFVTFSVTGELRRMARRLGYRAERLPGYFLKREMLRISHAGDSF